VGALSCDCDPLAACSALSNTLNWNMIEVGEPKSALSI